VLVGLLWAAFVPGGIFWTAILVAGMIGASVATALLVRSRSLPSLAQVIASVDAEPVLVSAPGGYTSGAVLRSRGERKP
jgi:hypothetical protein